MVRKGVCVWGGESKIIFFYKFKHSLYFIMYIFYTLN